MQNNNPYIVCFGEVLWDVYPDEKYLGGAPFNVAAHARQLGMKSEIISSVGDDANGQEILEAIKNQKLSTAYTTVNSQYATGVVNVVLNETGHPTYEIKAPVAWDYIVADDKIMELVSSSKALVYGSLACRSATSRHTLFELIKRSPLNICDLNIRLSFYDKGLVETLLQSANVLKINDDEAALLTQLFDLDENDFYKELSTQFSIDIIIQTLGAKGAEVYSNGTLHAVDAVKIEVVDTVGSGDAFLAAFIAEMLAGKELNDCLQFAVGTGGLLATKRGAVPVIKREEIYELINASN